MRKIIDFTETAVLTVFCFALIGVMLFEHLLKYLKAEGSEG